MDSRASRLSAGLVLAAALLATAWIYAPLAQAGLVYEDGLIGAPYEFRWAWPSRALTAWTFQATALTAGEHHAINVGVHVVNGLVLALLARPLAGVFGASLAAVVFLLHPIQSGAVAYLSARSDLLLTMGLLVALLGARRRDACALPLVACGSLLAGWSKELGAVVPLVVLWTWGVERRIGWRGAVIGTLVIGGALWAVDLGRWWEMSPHVGGSWEPWLTWLGLQIGMVGHLLALVVWPVGLSVTHDPMTIGTLTRLLTVIGALVVVGVAVASWRSRPRGLWGLGVMAILIGPRFVLRTTEFVTEPQLLPALVPVWIGIGALGDYWMEASHEQGHGTDAVSASGVSETGLSIGPGGGVREGALG